ALCPGGAGALDRTPRAGEGRRPQATKSTRRLKTDATGHDEGHALVLRSGPSCTRAPRLSPRSWRGSLVAAALGLVLHTSRRQGSRPPEAAAGTHHRHGFAAKR